MNGGQYAVPLLHSAVGIMTPFLLAATGGLFSELAGMLNIALEGLMLIGAFFSVVFAALTGSLLLGVLLGVLCSLLAAALFGFITLYLRANLFISGLATNLLASGLTVVLAFRIFGTKGVVRFQIGSLPVLRIPLLGGVPLLGDLLAGHNLLVYASWALVALAALVIYRTAFGLRLRAVGLGPQTTVSLGLSPRRYRMAGILISGFTCGLAGAGLTLGMSAFVPNITAGRGWIALVAIYLGNKSPLGILAACFVFGLAESLSNFAQGTIDVPADFVLAFPYLLTVLAMAGYSALRRRRGRS